MENISHNRIVRMTLVAVMAAFAYVSALLIRIPVVLFLSYEPKDIIVLLSALLLGPVEGMLVSVISSFAEMVTFSNTGWWGLLMNVLSTFAFILPGAILYYYKKRTSFLNVGILIGVVSMTGVMLLWNYLIVPLYMGTTREDVLPLLFTAFLPFNLLKGLINASLTVFLFLPLKRILEKSKLIPIGNEEKQEKEKWILFVVSGMVFVISVILFILF